MADHQSRTAPGDDRDGPVAAQADRIVAAVLAAPPRAGDTRVLAVDGPSGSGKTTLTRALAARLDGPPRVAVVHLDAIYPGWDGLVDGIDLLVEGVLRPLGEHRPAGYHRWDWMRGRTGRPVRLPDPPPGLVLVDGVGAGALPCAPYLSLLVWVEAPAGIRYARAMARDGEAYRANWHRWAAQEADYLRIHQPRGRAAIIVGTQDRGVL